MTHLPSHFSQRRPMAIPGCLRHMMRSGWCFAILSLLSRLSSSPLEQRAPVGHAVESVTVQSGPQSSNAFHKPELGRRLAGARTGSRDGPVTRRPWPCAKRAPSRSPGAAGLPPTHLSVCQTTSISTFCPLARVPLLGSSIGTARQNATHHPASFRTGGHRRRRGDENRVKATFCAILFIRQLILRPRVFVEYASEALEYEISCNCLLQSQCYPQ